MIKISIKNMHLFEVIDDLPVTYCGGYQGWYSAWWKRLSGCGPTVVSNIMNYISRKQHRDMREGSPLSKKDFQALMEEVWRFVTPSIRGIPTTAALIKGAKAYIAFKGLDLRLEEFEVPKKKLPQPEFTKFLDFIGLALQQDTPVAFLSLDKGQEHLLDSWHWVALLSLEYEEDGSAAFAEIADEGKLLRADLKKWFETTTLGGGIVRFMQ